MKKKELLLPVNGTVDFYGQKLKKRNFIINTIIDVCQQYNFEQIETPAFEYLNLIKNAYGEECNKLIYFILNSGDFLKNIDTTNPKNINRENLCKKCLRYDLTLPLMRFVMNNLGNIVFPFKRYQCQNVWRADRPQNGRYREFLQFDVDIVGSSSLLCEEELLMIVDKVFSKFKLTKYTIKINHRGILQDIATLINCLDRYEDFCVLIDKVDKIGIEEVFKCLKDFNIKSGYIDILRNIFNYKKTNDILNYLKNIFIRENIPLDNINTLTIFFEMCKKNNIKNVKVDFSLARGISYYTGIIFEVILDNYSIGSVCGGGRYGFFANKFEQKELNGVGISFGIDRLLIAIEDDNFNFINSGKILFLNKNNVFDFNLINKIREKGFVVDIYYDKNANFSKQLKYADRKNFDYVIFYDKDDCFVFKNMLTGDQKHIKNADDIDCHLQ